MSAHTDTATILDAWAKTFDGLADDRAKEEDPFNRGAAYAFRSAASRLMARQTHRKPASDVLAAVGRVLDRTNTGQHSHDLARLATARATLEEQIATKVKLARDGGDSWATIGDALGITKQAAQQRYGKKPTKHTDDGQLTLTD